jgi:mRNA interferase MazF
MSAVQFEDEDFVSGSLHRTSYARPGKIFTASESLMVTHIGALKDDSFRKVANAVIHLLQSHTPI